MYKFTHSDLLLFAAVWVNTHSYDPIDEPASIERERLYKKLLRVFEAAGEPLC
jgi:hypothetical protein